MYLRFRMKGLAATTRRLDRTREMLKARGVLGQQIRQVARTIFDYMRAITHVESGALRAAERFTFDPEDVSAVVDIDPHAPPRKGKTLPVEYGIYEHARGGTHAFMQRAMSERGPAALARAEQMLERSLGGD